jgi:hypothetical protein
MAGSPFTAPCSGETVNSDGVQVDTNGNIWVTGLTYVTSSTPAGALRSGFPFTNVNSISNGVLYQDYANNMWFIDQGANALNALAVSDGTETFASGVSFFALAPTGAALGTLAASQASNDNNGLAIFGATPSLGVLQISQLTPPPSQLPTLVIPSIPFTLDSVVIDGNSRIYFASGSTTQSSNFVEVYDNAYHQLSPEATGYTGGTEQSSLYQTSGVAVDQSGNLWVLNRSNYNALMKSGPYGAAYLRNDAEESNMDQFIGGNSGKSGSRSECGQPDIRYDAVAWANPLDTGQNLSDCPWTRV